MRKNNEYPQAIEQAQENLADLNERGADAIGNDALEFMDSILTQEELRKIFWLDIECFLC